MLQHVHRKAMKLEKSLENWFGEEWLREFGLFRLENRKLRGDLFAP